LRYALRQWFFFNHRWLAREFFEYFVPGARNTLVPRHRRRATLSFSFPSKKISDRALLGIQIQMPFAATPL